MDIAPVVTLVSYAVLFVQWGAVMWLYARFRREARDHDVVVSTLVTVLAVDAAKNLFESGYFGAMWLSHYGYVPTAFGDSTIAPLLPKVLHIAAATFVLLRLAGDFLPRELRERRRRRVEEERLRLEQEHSLALVKESEGRLQSLLERTTDIVCFWRVIDNDIVLESINSAGRAILGLGDDAVGTPAQLLAPDGLLVLLEGALATGEPVREEEGWLETGGGRRAVIRQVVPLPDPDGVIRRMTSFTHDVTALRQRQADEEARTRLESLGILAGGVAHDFNNLLAVLRADVDAATAAQATNDSREHLVHARLTIDRARDLVAQLLAMAGKRAPVTSAVDFGDVVDETVRLLRPGAPRGLALETDIAPDVVVVGDRPQLQQVVLNLIHNAIDAVSTVKGAVPTVRVSLRAVEGEAVLVVSDNGPGIEPAVQRRIFEPFFSTKRTGRGLGLATVFGLTQAHSGRVAIDSVVGAGATFTVHLPRTTARPQPVPRPSGKFAPPSLLPVDVEAASLSSSPSSSSPSSSPSSSTASLELPDTLTVLLIDDDDRVRRATRRLLERLGHTVIDVDGGEAGIAVSEQYDLAVVDVTMPGLDGPTTLARLRERRPGLPAVLVTGRGDLADDGDIVLTKPFDGDELKVALAAATSGSRIRRSA